MAFGLILTKMKHLVFTKDFLSEISDFLFKNIRLTLKKDFGFKKTFDVNTIWFSFSKNKSFFLDRYFSIISYGLSDFLFQKRKKTSFGFKMFTIGVSEDFWFRFCEERSFYFNRKFVILPSGLKYVFIFNTKEMWV